MGGDENKKDSSWNKKECVTTQRPRNLKSISWFLW